MSKQSIKTQYLSLKYTKLRCKKSLCWQIYLLLINQSENNDKRRKKQNNSSQRTYSIGRGSNQFNNREIKM